MQNDEAKSEAKPSGPASPGQTRTIVQSAEQAMELARLLDRYLEDLQAGRKPDRARFLAEHADLASALEPALNGLEFISRATMPAPDTPMQLGDFRIVREVGRGGMGVVYEAEQISLKRRVALKVLRYGGLADETAMQRFQREAETVAGLHHTNIVPIFAIGSDEGVRYYAMQFLEGRNLAELQTEAREGGRSLAVRDIAGWGLQAAEALAHAHQRGVIHRDIKPSNFILDGDGRIWLTDFGLARRLDDVVLSVAGALLGTPRYMSPEQARASAEPVDHRTDIYSLGATLYELATSRPIFEAATPHEVLSQILNAEPIPPRRLAPSLPRDLETIILKCLAKDPTRRYSTARELADDLRAFQEGRAIKARRASLAEQAARWARKHRQSTTVAAASAAASIVLLALAFGGWTIYRQSRLGELTLTTKEPLLEAEVLEAVEDKPVLPSFSLPTRQPVALPEGEYRVRLSTEGRLSETLDLQVRRRQSQQLEVALTDRQLFEPFAVAMVDSVETIDLAGSADFVSARMWEARRIDGATGKELWKVALGMNKGRAWWQTDAQRDGWSQFFSRQKKGPRLARPAPDLDGDGVGDLVWASEANPTLLALSGRTGQVLWWHIAPWPIEATGLAPDQVFEQWPAAEACVPAVADVDNDGTPDLIATFSSRDWHWVEAVSGKSGTTLWRRTLDRQWFKAPSGSNQKITPMPKLARVDNEPVVVLAPSLRLVVLSLRTGESRWELELPRVTLQEPRIADLDGDGSDDVLLLADHGYRRTSLAAYSLKAKNSLWVQRTAAVFEPYTEEPEQLDWPVVADLDHDGKFEILLPAGSAGVPETAERESLWSGLDVLDGKDGSLRFRRVLQRAGHRSAAQVNRFVVGPDIDGDGAAEIFAASTVSPSLRKNDTWLYLDAVSGRDGHSVWWWRTPLQSWNDGPGLLALWPEGPDGHPQVVVSAVSWPKKAEGIYVLEGGSGRLLHRASGAFAPEVVEITGDGLPELCYRLPHAADIRHGSGTLVAVRGLAPAVWRHLKYPFGNQVTFPDIDGDGAEDILFGNPVQALSGATGRQLWIADGNARHFRPLRLPEGDLDQDGVPDVLTIQSGVGAGGSYFFEPVTAVSGATGRRLWKAPLKSQQVGELHLAECVNLDNRGPAEVVLIMGMGLDQLPAAAVGSQQPSNRLWLAVISARDGSLVWRQPLSEPYLAGDSDWQVAPAIADLDGDGVREVVAGALTSDNAWEIRAFNGADGRELWRQPLANQVGGMLYRQFQKRPEPVVGDLDGDGAPEVMVVDYTRQPEVGMNSTQFDCELLVLDGRTGTKKWSWTWVEQSEDRRVLPLLVNLRGGSGRDVCLLTGHFDRSEVVLLDARGQVAERLPIKLRTWPGRVWHGDLDGDGLDELLYLTSDGQLHAVRGSLRQTLWQQPADQVHGIRSVAGEPPTVIVQRGRDMVGLAGPTGVALWRGPCSTVAPRHPVLLAGAHRGGPPCSVGTGPGSLLLQKMLPTLPTGEYRPSTGGQTARVSLPRDPRLARPLPWNFFEHAPQRIPLEQLRSFGMMVLTEGTVLALMLALPAALAGWIWRRWSWKAGIPAVLGAAAVVVLGLLSIYPLAVWRQLGPMAILRPLLGVPHVVFVAACARSLWHRRWRRLGLIVAAAVALALMLAVAWLLLDARGKSPGEYYVRGGSGFVLLFGSYFVGLALALAWLGRAALGRWKKSIAARAVGG